MKKIITIILILALSISCSANKQEKREENKKYVGGWESTAQKGSYYVFKNDVTFYWYKSAKD